MSNEQNDRREMIISEMQKFANQPNTLPSTKRQVHAWADRLATLPTVVPDGELWSFIRSVMTQGVSIQQDYAVGTHKTYEAYSARLDAAASERADELQARLSAAPSPLAVDWEAGRFAGKVTQHWLRVAFERIAAGESEAIVLADYGYEQPAQRGTPGGGEAWLPPNGAYIIRYDDQDRRDEFFAVSDNARDVAFQRFEQITGNWNAHLFVKIRSNCRDVEVPDAAPPTSASDKQGEIDALREVYECARALLRFGGVDGAKVREAARALDAACERVKLIDSGLADDGDDKQGDGPRDALQRVERWLAFFTDNGFVPTREELHAQRIALQRAFDSAKGDAS